MVAVVDGVHDLSCSFLQALDFHPVSHVKFQQEFKTGPIL